MSREWLDSLNPEWRKILLLESGEAISVGYLSGVVLPSVEQLSKQFPAPFWSDCDSAIKDKLARLVLKPDFTPVKHGCYSYAFGAMKPVENVLDS